MLWGIMRIVQYNYLAEYLINGEREGAKEDLFNKPHFKYYPN